MNRREALERAGLVLGYAVSAPVLLGILKGCKAVEELPYKPVFFNEEQARVVSEIAEIMIPRTDTPGAKEAGVPAFIDQILSQCCKKEDQERFLSGLMAFEKEAKETYDDDFIDLEPAQREAHVRKVHDQALAAYKEGRLKKKDAQPITAFENSPFILMVKEFALVGFFTSEAGANQVLQYAPVPGAYHGCLPLSQVGKAWATS